MKGFILCLVWATLRQSNAQSPVPASVSNCCEGDILLLLDSSGSVLNYEFSHLLLFTAELLRPFSLGQGHVRVGLLQVGTDPQLEFGLNVYSHQDGLQRALQSISQLQGDTNTVAALRVAKRELIGTKGDVPKILLWLTDGVQPGDVDQLMTELKAEGVFVLVVSIAHGSFQVLQRAVTPPLESHLYSVDIEDIEIITDNLREAIIKIIRAERLRVVDLTSHSAVLQWRPLLRETSSYYELRYKSVWTPDNETRGILPGDSSWVALSDLRPDTTYTASLHPESNQGLFKALSVNFTTLPVTPAPDVFGPTVVSVSDSGPHQIHVSWGSLQPAQVQRYTVEYSAIPSGPVHTVTRNSQQNSASLTGLDPGTQYLITVTALHVNGKERAMSVKACTKEAALPALVDLQLTPGQHQDVQVAWQAHQEDLAGYWLTWEQDNSVGSTSESALTSAYLLPTARLTHLTHLAASSRVCVSPVYSSGRGDGICCTIPRPTESSQWDQPPESAAIGQLRHKNG